MEKHFLHKTLQRSANLLQVENGHWIRPDWQNQFLMNFFTYFSIFYRKNDQTPLKPMITQNFYGKVAAICKGPQTEKNIDTFFAAYPMFLIQYAWDENEKLFTRQQKLDLDPILINPSNLFFFSEVQLLVVSCNHGGLGKYKVNTENIRYPLELEQAKKTTGAVLSTHLMNRNDQISFARLESNFQFRIYEVPSLVETRCINLTGLAFGNVYMTLPFNDGTIFICENGPFLFDSDEYSLSRITTLDFQSPNNLLDLSNRTSDIIDSPVIDWCNLGSDICLLSQNSKLYRVGAEFWTCKQFVDEKFDKDSRYRKIRRVFHLHDNWVILLNDLESYIIDLSADSQLQQNQMQMGNQMYMRSQMRRSYFIFESGLNYRGLSVTKSPSLIPSFLTYNETKISLLRSGSSDRTSPPYKNFIFSNAQDIPIRLFTVNDMMVISFKNESKLYHFGIHLPKFELDQKHHDNFKEGIETVGFGHVSFKDRDYYVQAATNGIFLTNFITNEGYGSEKHCKLFSSNEEGFIAFHNYHDATLYVVKFQEPPNFIETTISFQPPLEVSCVALPSTNVTKWTNEMMKQKGDKSEIPQTLLIGICETNNSISSYRYFIRIFSFENFDFTVYAEHLMPSKVIQACYLSLTRILLVLQDKSIVAIRYDCSDQNRPTIQVTNTFTIGEGIPNLSLFDYPEFHIIFALATNSRTVKMSFKNDTLVVQPIATMPFSLVQKASPYYFFSVTGKTFYLHKFIQESPFAYVSIDPDPSEHIETTVISAEFISKDPRAFIVTTARQINLISTEDNDQQDPRIAKLPETSSYVCSCLYKEKYESTNGADYREFIFAIIKNNFNSSMPDQMMQQMQQGMGSAQTIPPGQSVLETSPYTIRMIDLGKGELYDTPLNECYNIIAAYNRRPVCAHDTTLALFRHTSSSRFLECLIRSDNIGTCIQALKFESTYVFVGDANLGILIYNTSNYSFEKIWAEPTHRLITSINIFNYSYQYLISSGDREGNITLYFLQPAKSCFSVTTCYSFNVGEPISSSVMYNEQNSHSIIYYATIAGGIGGFLCLRKNLFPQMKTPDWLRVNLLDLAFIEKKIAAYLTEVIGINPYEFKNKTIPSSSVIDMDIIELYMRMPEIRQTQISNELNGLHEEEKINVKTTAKTVSDIISQMKLYFVK